MMDKGMELPQSSNSSAFVDKTLSRVHNFYISGEIRQPSEYTSWFETIRNSSEVDVIIFHINSYGGDLFTAIQFMRVMNETKATIVASVEGACMSAATLIFLTARHWEISNHSMFMFHNYSSGTFGKGGEMYDMIIHSKAWSEKLWKDVFDGFLTKDEINSILNNKDIWMSGEEVTKRLQVKAKNMKDTVDLFDNPKKVIKKPIKKASASQKAAPAKPKQKRTPTPSTPQKRKSLKNNNL